MLTPELRHVCRYGLEGRHVFIGPTSDIRSAYQAGSPRITPAIRQVPKAHVEQQNTS